MMASNCDINFSRLQTQTETSALQPPGFQAGTTPSLSWVPSSPTADPGTHPPPSSCEPIPYHQSLLGGVLESPDSPLPSVGLHSLSQPAWPPAGPALLHPPLVFHPNAAPSWESSFHFLTVTRITSHTTARPPDPRGLPPGPPKHSHPVPCCHTHASPQAGADGATRGGRQGWLSRALPQTPGWPGGKKRLAPFPGPPGQVAKHLAPSAPGRSG